MNDAERDAFIREHRTAVFGHNRKSDPPAMSLLYYVTEPDGSLLMSTTADRSKAKAVARDKKASLCILDEQWPPSYLNVYCDAEVDTDFDLAVETMQRIGSVMAGAPLGDDIRPALEKKARDEHRVTIRLRPYGFAPRA